MEKVGLNDLEYAEYSNYVRRALISSGYVPSEKFDEIEIFIFMSYGIGDPITAYKTYSVPQYGKISGGTSSFSALTAGTGGTSSTIGTITEPTQYGVVGSRTQVRSETTYFRYLVLEAIDAGAFKKDKKIIPVWKTTVTSRGSSDDLRRVFPILVAAARPYIGTNTEHKIKVRLKEKNPEVLFIKGIDASSK
ncbi:MAG: hypothetical protein HY538_06715 [Deltaproteobacteria bacterium]|nr:hypothetical protein [Deltaproteobacteria bacterium]